MNIDDRILAVLRDASAPITGGAIAAVLADGTTASQVRRAVARLRASGVDVACWIGRAGGYIHPAREDLLFPHSVGSVIAECESIAGSRELH